MSNGSEAAVYVRPPSDDELLRSFERKVQNVRHSFRRFPNDRFSQIPESALNKPSTLYHRFTKEVQADAASSVA